MKKFNKVVSVDMSADVIAEMFLNSQAFLFENKEAFIETVIGTCLEKGTLGTVLGGFLGVVPKCHFELDTVVYCTAQTYDYSTKESQENNDSVSREIGEATIIGLNPYAYECYQILYVKYKSDGSIFMYEQWVPTKSLECVSPMSHQL